MCYLLITKQLTDRPSKKNASIIKEVMLEQMKRNNDGFSLYKPKDNFLKRTLDEEETKKAIETLDIDGVIYHARLASVGAVTQGNVHGYEYNGWTYSHNGGSSDYSATTKWNTGQPAVTSRNQDHTDSKLFFYDLIDEIEARKAQGHKEIAKAIQAQYNEVSWWGRASLYHKDSDRLFLFGGWHTYNIANEFIAISSADVLDIPQRTEKVRGLDFETSFAGGIYGGTLDGIAVIKNFTQPNWSLKFLAPLKDLDMDRICKTTRVASAYTTYEGSPYTCQLPAVAESLTVKEQEEKDEEEAREWEEYNGSRYNQYGYDDFEWLYDMNGERVEVYTDREGTHDTMGQCCIDNTCDLFFDSYKEAVEYSLEKIQEAEADEAELLNSQPLDEWLDQKTETEKTDILERMLK